MEYYDQDGVEIGFLEWAIRMNDAKEVRILSDQVGEFTISTVWLGLNMAHHPTAKKLIFETMVFEEGESLDCMRWETKEKAMEGHRHWVDQFRSLGGKEMSPYEEKE